MNNCGNASPTSHVVAAVTTNHNNNAISDNTNISNCVTSNSNNSNNSATSTNNNYLHNSNHSNYLMLPNHHQELHNHSPVHHHQSIKHHTNNSSNGKTSVSNNFNKNLLQSTIQQNSSGVLNVNNSIGSGSAKRTMDDVLKRLTNKMKGSSIREGRRQQHQQQTSPSPTSGNRWVKFIFWFYFTEL